MGPSPIRVSSSSDRARVGSPSSAYDAAMPAVPSEVVPALLAAHRDSTRPVTVPKYRYSQGRPFLLDREIWPRLLGLEGTALPEAVIATHERWVQEVWIDHLAPSVMATPDDLSDAAPRR